MKRFQNVDRLIIVGGIIAIAGPILALAPALVSLALIPFDGGAAGQVLPWLMIVTLPIGALGAVFGFILCSLGLFRSTRKIIKGSGSEGTPRDYEKLARLTLLVRVPLLAYVWPVICFVSNNMVDLGIIGVVINFAFPAMQLAITAIGLYWFYFKARATRAKIIIPIVVFVSTAWTLTATVFLSAFNS